MRRTRVGLRSSQQCSDSPPSPRAEAVGASARQSGRARHCPRFLSARPDPRRQRLPPPSRRGPHFPPRVLPLRLQRRRLPSPGRPRLRAPRRRPQRLPRRKPPRSRKRRRKPRHPRRRRRQPRLPRQHQRQPRPRREPPHRPRHLRRGCGGCSAYSSLSPSGRSSCCLFDVGERERRGTRSLPAPSRSRPGWLTNCCRRRSARRMPSPGGTSGWHLGRGWMHSRTG